VVDKTSQNRDQGRERREKKKEKKNKKCIPNGLG
jgi:hypothetical protein